MIRQELIHPVISHFPIVLLVLLPFAFIYHLKAQAKESMILYRSSLYIGSVFFFMSLFTGDEAFEIIKPNFCHLLDIYQHDESAHDALVVLIGVIAIDSCFYVEHLKKFKKMISVGMVIISIFLAILIGRTAHHGAMLVYEKGAAVTPVMQATCTP